MENSVTEATTSRRSRSRTKIRHNQKLGEMPNLNRHWRSLFLDCLAETSNVSASATAAGINTSQAYKVRRYEQEFARAWYAALLEGYQHLELETLHRLRMGTEKDDPKFDIANALRLLAIHKDTVSRERAKNEAAGQTHDEQAVLSSINAKIDALRAKEPVDSSAANDAQD